MSDKPPKKTPPRKGSWRPSSGPSDQSRPGSPAPSTPAPRRAPPPRKSYRDAPNPNETLPEPEPEPTHEEPDSSDDIGAPIGAPMALSPRLMGSSEPSSKKPILVIGGLVVGLSMLAGIVIAVVLFVSMNSPEALPTLPSWNANNYEDDEEEFEDISIRPRPTRPRPVTPTPAAPAAPQLAPATISIADATLLTGLQVSCPNAGINKRVSLVNKKATTPPLPVQGPCTVNFRGGASYKLVHIRGGQTLSCTFGAGIAKCQ